MKLRAHWIEWVGIARFSPATRVTTVLLLVAGMALLSGCGGGANRTQRSRYIQADLPTGGLGLYVEGTLAREAGQEDAALELFLEASQRDERLILVNDAIADIYEDRGELNLAERFLRRLVALDPRTVGNYVRLGDTLMLLERVTDALDTYREGVEIKPENGPANYGAGRALLALDQPEQAKSHLEIAVEQMPGAGEAWLNYGRALSATSSPAEAETAYRRALETLDETTPDVYRGLGISLLQQSRPGEAATFIQQAASDTDSADDFKLLGDAHMFASDYEQAVTAYDGAIGRRPDYLDAINAKGTARYQQFVAGGRLDTARLNQAVDLWKASLRINPDQPRVRQTLDQVAPGSLDEES